VCFGVCVGVCGCGLCEYVGVFLWCVCGVCICVCVVCVDVCVYVVCLDVRVRVCVV